MAESFGVRYYQNYPASNNICKNASIGCDTSGRFNFKGTDCFLYGGKPRHWYIHPDSYGIFEPQEGDLMLDETGDTWKAAKAFKLEGINAECEILRRDDKPFILPEKD